jgi:hypothetical protein
MDAGPKEQQRLAMPIPDELIDSFGDACRARRLLDDEGRFNDPLRLIDVFCNTPSDNEKGISHHQRRCTTRVEGIGRAR